jgi:hypothetical protein
MAHGIATHRASLDWARWASVVLARPAAAADRPAPVAQDGHSSTRLT